MDIYQSIPSLEQQRLSERPTIISIESLDRGKKQGGGRKWKERDRNGGKKKNKNRKEGEEDI